jgi:hypothetical protein
MKRTKRKEKTTSKKRAPHLNVDDCVSGIVLSNRRPAWTCFVDSLLFALLYRPSNYVVQTLLAAPPSDLRTDLLELARKINTAPPKGQSEIYNLSDTFFANLFTGIHNYDQTLLTDFNQHTESSIEEDDEMRPHPPFGDVIDVYNGLRDILQFPPLTTLGYDLHTFETQELIRVDSDENVFQTLQNMNITATSDTLIIPLNRIGDGASRLTKPHIPPEMIEVVNDGQRKQYHLSAVVNYKGRGQQVGHYTCYVRCNNTFYYFDDTEPKKVKTIGSYDNLLKVRSDKIQTQGLLFVYKDLSMENAAKRLLLSGDEPPLIGLAPPYEVGLPPKYDEDDDKNFRAAMLLSMQQPNAEDDDADLMKAIEASKHLYGGSKLKHTTRRTRQQHLYGGSKRKYTTRRKRRRTHPH